MSSRLSPPGGVSPGASRWYAATKPAGPLAIPKTRASATAAAPAVTKRARMESSLYVDTCFSLCSERINTRMGHRWTRGRSLKVSDPPSLPGTRQTARSRSLSPFGVAWLLLAGAATALVGSVHEVGDPLCRLGELLGGFGSGDPAVGDRLIQPAVDHCHQVADEHRGVNPLLLGQPGERSTRSDRGDHLTSVDAQGLRDDCHQRSTDPGAAMVPQLF